MHEHYLGVDLHNKRSYVVLMNAQGEIEDQRRLANEEVADYVKQLPSKTYAVLEATRNWNFMYDLLTSHLDTVVMAHPLKVRAIAAARVKTDKIDATTLAHLARADLLPTAYAPPQETRQLRDLVRHRSQMVRERTRHKNQVHALLSKYNLRSPKTDLFGKKGRMFLDAHRQELPAPHQFILDNHLAQVDRLNGLVRDIEKAIHAYTKPDPRMRLLMSMPGIGEISAAVILAEIGDIHRFEDAKHLCSYAGLVPSVRSSDLKVHHGRITKQGSAWLRWIMVSAATRAHLKSPRLAEFNTRLRERHGAKTARVALARKMLTIVYFMLTHKELFQEKHQPDGLG